MTSEEMWDLTFEQGFLIFLWVESGDFFLGADPTPTACENIFVCENESELPPKLLFFFFFLILRATGLQPTF